MFLGAFYWTVDSANTEATEIYSNKSSATSVNWNKMKYQNDGHLMAYIGRVGDMLRLKPTSPADISLMANALTPKEVIDLTGNGIAGNVTNSPPATMATGALPTTDQMVALVGSGSIDWKHGFVNAMSAPGKWLLHTMIGSLTTGENDPLSSMSSIGHLMIGTGEGVMGLADRYEALITQGDEKEEQTEKNE